MPLGILYRSSASPAKEKDTQYAGEVVGFGIPRFITHHAQLTTWHGMGMLTACAECRVQSAEASGCAATLPCSVDVLGLHCGVVL